MADGVAGRILIRHLARCEMRSGTNWVQANGAFMLLFGEFFFFPSAILAKVQKDPSVEREAAFSQDCWQQMRLNFFCHMAV